MLEFRIFNVTEGKYVTDSTANEFSVHLHGKVTFRGNEVTHEQYLIQQKLDIVDSFETVLYEGDVVEFKENPLMGRYKYRSRYATITYRETEFVLLMQVTQLGDNQPSEGLALSIKPYKSIIVKAGTVFSSDITHNEMIQMEIPKDVVVQETKTPESGSL